MFDLTHTIAAPLFENTEYPWQVLPGIRGLYPRGRPRAAGGAV